MKRIVFEIEVNTGAEGRTIKGDMQVDGADVFPEPLTGMMQRILAAVSETGVAGDRDAIKNARSIIFKAKFAKRLRR